MHLRQFINNNVNSYIVWPRPLSMWQRLQRPLAAMCRTTGSYPFDCLQSAKQCVASSSNASLLSSIAECGVSEGVYRCPFAVAAKLILAMDKRDSNKQLNGRYCACGRVYGRIADWCTSRATCAREAQHMRADAVCSARDNLHKYP